MKRKSTNKSSTSAFSKVFESQRSEKGFQKSIPEIVCWGLVILVPTLVPVFTYRLTLHSLTNPWGFSGDILSAYSFSQSWFHGIFGFKSTIYGAPHLIDYRYDTFDFLNAALMVLGNKFSGNPFMAVNLFYLLTFPLSALTFAYVARVIGIKRSIASWLGIVFSVLPFHFYRFGQGHVSLSGYYMIPLGVLSIIRIRELLLQENRIRSVRPLKSFSGCFIVNIFVGSAVAYYTLFLALLGGTFLLIECVLSRRLILDKLLKAYLALGGLLLVPLSIVATRPPADFPINRQLDESLTFGGSILKILIPWVPVLPARLKSVIDPIPFELEWVGISVISWLGILALAHSSTYRPALYARLRYLRTLIVISILAYLSGGIGFIFSAVVTTDFRAWNRFSIIIECLALLGLGVVLTQLASTLTKVVIVLSGIATLTFAFTLLPLSSLGIGKVPTPADLEVIDQVKEVGDVLDEHIEPGCSVLVLPIMLYPEGGIVNDVYSGDHFRLGIINPQFRWSFGSSKYSSEGHFWESRSQPDLGEGVGELREAKRLGFCAAVLDERANLANALRFGHRLPENSRLYDIILFD